MRGFVVLALIAVSAASLGAQTIETPIPFDSAHRVLAVTPVVAERLGLAPSAWPVTGAYREARLYSIEPGGGFVLVVQRSSGALERFLLSSIERTTLRDAVDAAMAASGRPSAEVAADVVSEPAGNSFARRQVFLAALVYGPLAASLADNEAGAGALYLAYTGASFFVAYGAAHSNEFTRAQSDLAGDFGLAAATGGWLVGYASTGNSERGVRALSLASGVGGTIVGAVLGVSLTDAEAHAATMGIETTAATALTVSSFANADTRATSVAVTVAGGLGYVLGVRYPRHASYTVTAGDVEAISTSALVGAAFAAVTLNGRPSPKRVAGTLGAGYLAGELVGDRLLARPFDLTQAQANLLRVGALAGALVGLAIPVLSGSSGVPFTAGAAASGAALGMGLLAGTFATSSGARLSQTRLIPTAAARQGLRVSISPLKLASALLGAPGHHVLARVTF